MRYRATLAHSAARRPRGVRGAPWLALAALCGALAIAPVMAQTIPLATDAVELPTVPVANADVAVADHARVVWLVQTDTTETRADPASADSALAFIFAREDGATMHGEHGAFRAAAGAAHGRRLAAGQVVPLATMSGADLRVRVSLVDTRLLPDRLPAGAIASEPFAAPGTGVLHIELRHGALGPAQRGLVLADEAPALVLALDYPLRVERQHEPASELPRGGLTLLAQNATLRNPGVHSAAFIVTWLDPRANAAAGTVALPAAAARDAALDDAWQRNGCHLNPGNPACLIVSLAATCASDPTTAGCGGDSDGDTCRDVAEVRTGLDPFDRGDCIGAGDGSPLLNCLFLAGNLACDGSIGAARAACPAEIDAREGPLPEQAANCDPTTRFASVDCGLIARDPTCDGFDLNEGDGVMG